LDHWSFSLLPWQQSGLEQSVSDQAH
jgi:hypothetical protein